MKLNQIPFFCGACKWDMHSVTTPSEKNEREHQKKRVEAMSHCRLWVSMTQEVEQIWVKSYQPMERAQKKQGQDNTKVPRAMNNLLEQMNSKPILS